MMKYKKGKEIQLGDVVELEMPDGKEIARVVMLGETGGHLKMEKNYINWVIEENILSKDSIVVEWINNNPLAHNNPKYAPVGNYMSTGISDDITLIQRLK